MENKAIKGFREAIEEVIHLQDAKNYDDAILILEKLIELVEDADMFNHTDAAEYFCFNNVLEQVLYDEVFGHGKELFRVPDNYADMYHKYGALLFEAKEYDDAELFLKKAHRWNPVDVDILFELSEVYKLRSDWDTFLSIMKQCLSYAYSNRSLARCYRNLGFYFIEQEQYDVAAALYLFSLFFDQKNETAYHELKYIEEKTGNTPRQPESTEEASALIHLLNDHEIQTWANPQVTHIAVSMAREAMKADMPNEARSFLSIAYELTGDKDIGEVLDQLSEQLDDNKENDDSESSQLEFDEDDYEQDEGKYDGEI
jgi:tetratricopeptide (TPR) repeat protein